MHHLKSENKSVWNLSAAFGKIVEKKSKELQKIRNNNWDQIGLFSIVFTSYDQSYILLSQCIECNSHP